MNGKNWERVAELFGVLSEAGVEERAGVWAELGAVEAEVRAEVESLLAAHDRAGGYLEQGVLADRRPEVGERVGAWRLEEVVGEGG